MHPCAGCPIHVSWDTTAAQVFLAPTSCGCIWGHASTSARKSDGEQQLCPSKRCVPIEMKGTACTGIHRTPVHPCECKHSPPWAYNLAHPIEGGPSRNLVSYVVFMYTNNSFWSCLVKIAI